MCRPLPAVYFNDNVNVNDNLFRSLWRDYTLQKYDLVREEQNYSRIFSTEREYFRDGCLKIKQYFNSHKEKKGNYLLHLIKANSNTAYLWEWKAVSLIATCRIAHRESYKHKKKFAIL